MTFSSSPHRVAEAELGEFVWDGRIAECDLGAYESEDDDEFDGSDRVRVLSIFRGRYRVATWSSTAPAGFG